MNYQYTCKKKKYDLGKVRKAQILFLNGDFVEIASKEILDLDVSLYDKLIHFNDCYSPVAKSGFIKIAVSKRKAFIEKLCIEEGIFAIRLFDFNNWNDTIICQISVKKENNVLILSFLENPSLGSFDRENHVINLKDVNKEDFRVLVLDFENCDGIEVYQDEIKEISLNFEKELEWNSFGYSRVVKNGYIRLKIDKNFHFGRKVLMCKANSGKQALRYLERRICGKGEDDVDICHLYISNYYCGYGLEKEERIGIKDTSEYLENNNESDGCEKYIPYISGYAKKEKDGSILITFGEKDDKNRKRN